MGVITTFLGAVAGKLAVDEAKAWLPRMSRGLLSLAVLRLPIDQRARYTEEWAADLDSFPGEVTKILRSLGFLYASCRVSGQFPEILKTTLRWFFPRPFYVWFYFIARPVQTLLFMSGILRGHISITMPPHLGWVITLFATTNLLSASISRSAERFGSRLGRLSVKRVAK
jgi:hypothetical protein